LSAPSPTPSDALLNESCEYRQRLVGVTAFSSIVRTVHAALIGGPHLSRFCAEVAERVGCGSASTFGTAFSRHVGQAPGRHARAVVANRTRTKGIQISDVPVPEGTREQFSFFRGLLQRAPAGLDLFETDLIWPRLFEGDLIDLRSQ